MRKRRFGNAPGIILVATLIGLCAYLLGWSKALEIRTIEISASGNESLVNQILIPRDLHIGMPIARVSAQRISHDLAGFTWISAVKINRRWLAHDLRITITEHKAIAQYVDSNGLTEYFDGKGLNFTAPNPPAGLPIIDFTLEGPESRSAIATFLAQVPGELTAHLSRLSVDIQNQVEMTTTIPRFKNLAITWGTATDIPLKVRVLHQLLTLAENKKITSVNVSSPMTPVVK
jgi:cell division septal protein FtsQ